MKSVEKTIAIGMLLFAIGFNLWLYRLEPTATIDPNDNTFQYALVDRTNQIWDYAQQSCANSKLKAQSSKLPLLDPLKRFALCASRFALLFDHWVPNWAQGYNLPTYYSHLPQIAIVSSFRFMRLILQCPMSNDQCPINLFQYYHWVIYLILSLFPLSVFLALRVIRLPFLVAGIGALLASHISTDGLYGLDPPSFLWRGYGLSSQLFAMTFLPLAIAYSWRFFDDQVSQGSGRQFLRELAFRLKLFSSITSGAKRHLATNGNALGDKGLASGASRKNSSAASSGRSFCFAVFFLIATTSGHLGIGIIAMLSLIPLAVAQPLLSFLVQPSIAATLRLLKINLTKLFLLAGTSIFFLSYWIIPIVLFDNYHNISVWDPPWKFNSFGAKEIMIRLLNGDLFDFGRFPVLTMLVIVGILACVWKKFEARNPKRETLLRKDASEGQANSNDQNSKFETVSNFEFRYSSFALLFLFWLLFYFGRTTWGGLIDAIPGMKEFHLSRFIVGLHLAGLFLAPIGLWRIVESLWSLLPQRFLFPIKFITVITIIIFIVVSLFPQTIRYNDLNNTLIAQANRNYAKVKTDVDGLIAELKARMAQAPGRVYSGRGGNWGKDFKVAETPYYIHLSTFGIPTVLWLPQTWSPNSDVEQYFSEDDKNHYDLFGIRYVATPPTVKPQPFWEFIKETKTWKLYEVQFPTPDVDEIHTSGVSANAYITSGVRPAVVAVDKRSYVNVIRLWIQSTSPKFEQGFVEALRQGESGKSDKTRQRWLYPELTFAKDYPRKTGLPNFKMLDEVTYVVPDGSVHNLFREPPLYLPPGATDSAAIGPSFALSFAKASSGEQATAGDAVFSQSSDSDMVFKTRVRVPKDCTECIVILKQSSHPNWRVTIDGKPVRPFSVFPVFLAVEVPEGTHDVVFSYEPSKLKIVLLLISTLVALLVSFTRPGLAKLKTL